MAARKRRDAIGCIAPVAGLLGVALLLLALVPERPAGPRYEGAGNPTPRNGGTFVFHHESNVRSLDPQVAYDELSTMANRLVFDGLLDYDQEGELVPSLAVAVPTPSEDGRLFRFRLRQGVRFHPLPGHPEGRELVAEDVRYTMERLLREETGSPGAGFYMAIEGAEAFREGEAAAIRGVKVLDRYTIEFRLAEPDQSFLYVMAMPFAYPVARETFEHYGDEADRHPSGVGPFTFASWERGVQLTFARNDAYWREYARPDRMVFLENIQRHLAGLRFMNGQIDAIHRQTLDHWAHFSQAERWANSRQTFPRASIWGVAMNHEMEPFDDVHFRRAVAFAIDREGWARARGNLITPTGQPLPPQIMGYDEDLPNAQSFDLERAKEEMALAGYPDGYPREIEYWGSDGDVSRIYAELLQQDLARIGIRVRIRYVSFAVFLEQTGKPKTVELLMGGWNIDYPDPSSFLEPLFHSKNHRPENSSNRSHYQNPELDELLDRARRETDAERRRAMYVEASDLLAEDAAWAFAYLPLTQEVWQPYVMNYRPHPLWAEDYRSVWLDLPRKRVAQQLLGDGSSLPAAFFPLGLFAGGSR
ncbi:MAG: ABC transporter substrate-binding protein [Myxococcota bacterium]